ncbi:reverse transcriptase domain-containing protein [Nephila pilipes]|uniref:Reverse transcriptase domain-containing protein n=1 Tax=Nephila pilipes TaxID=299642 RepID=A0A8X6UGU5_NEPPI|nr:reverse transcriptase domain-containing protein [Nephila pilipes]
MGADMDFISLCQDIYKDSNTSVLGLEGKTPPIPLKNGIKQGCPMSGILFDIAIDHVLRLIQGDEDRKKILAFADDIVLLANSKNELQDNIIALSHLLEDIHLKVNGVTGCLSVWRLWTCGCLCCSLAVSGLSLLSLAAAAACLAVRSGVVSCCRCCRCVRPCLLPLLSASRRFAAAVSGPASPVPADCSCSLAPIGVDASHLLIFNLPPGVVFCFVPSLLHFGLLAVFISHAFYPF